QDMGAFRSKFRRCLIL
ncbi:acrB/AcrD/AcrF family protein, partial [Vibrio parahaemolyticus EKP-028]